jgi:hypothetical protein
MKSLSSIIEKRYGWAIWQCAVAAVFVRFVLPALVICLVTARPMRAQVAPAADAGGILLSVGGTGSGYELQYGQRSLLGVSGFVDADLRRHVGVEAEGRWLIFHETANVHTATYLAGPRGFWQIGRFEPYAKGLAGIGSFNFPYNYAHGRYLVIAPGAGVDYRLNHRVRLRLVDFEYQYWPQFTYGAMSSYGISSGIRFRIF